jgi:hypothetical protein
MNTIKLQLVLTVEFEHHDVSKQELVQNLEQIVKDAVNNGTLTGESPAMVEKYSYTVVEVEPNNEGCDCCGVNDREKDSILCTECIKELTIDF